MAKISLTAQLFSLLLLLSSCTTQMMNKQSYGQISIGMSAGQARMLAGEPYRITEDQNGQNYEYIERFDIGPNTTNHTVYVLAVQNDVIVDKYIKNETPRVNFSTP